MNPINHVAIIMDGNGRWGIEKKNSRNHGHTAGLKTIEKIIKETAKQKIRYLTLYAFSTENWKRPKSEVLFLFKLLEDFLLKKTNELNKNGIKFKSIGSKKNLPDKLNKILINSENKTKNNSNLQINLALNYGSKNELISAFKKVMQSNLLINEKNIEKKLYTNESPVPDLLIRTGNTRRLSNFLLWQLAYAEIYFEKKLWPDFSIKDYIKILNNFKKLKLNFGSI